MKRNYMTMLANGLRREIAKRDIRLAFTEAGAARGPIYAEIRVLRRLLARADKVTSNIIKENLLK